MAPPEEKWRALRRRQVLKHGVKVPGRTEELAWLAGRSLTLEQAVRAHCYSCCGDFADSPKKTEGFDCENPACPLYGHFAYRTVRAMPGWVKDRARDVRRSGRLVWGRGDLLRYWGGESLTLKESVWARCYDCQDHYRGSRAKDEGHSCNNPGCELYDQSPFRKVGVP